MNHIEIHTDGACKGNPGPGGWGALLRYGGVERELFGGEAATTNNRMELTAAMETLKALKRDVEITIHTDSQYVVKGITQWVHGWKKNGWKNAAKKPVENKDLWEGLYDQTYLQGHKVHWKWVRGHSGDAMNERVDQLAVAACQKYR